MSFLTSQGHSGSGSPLHQRLSEQLESLSQVGELLTLRLLELEERLESFEVQLVQLRPWQELESPETNALLAATTERISRLEDLLTNFATEREQVEAPLHVVPHAEGLAPKHPPAEPVMEAEVNGLDEQELELHPFPDEDEEQPFMDELSA